MNGGPIDDAWARAADLREAALPKLGSYPVAGLLRRARRIAGISQRELARRVGVSPSTVGRIESGAIVPVLPTFAKMIAIAGLWLVMVDNEGHIVQPMRDIDDIRNGGGHLYPSHLDTVLDPRPGEWWGDQYGLARPPETFHRDPRRREAQRARSVYSVRTIWSYGLGDMSAMPRDLQDDQDDTVIDPGVDGWPGPDPAPDSVTRPYAGQKAGPPTNPRATPDNHPPTRPDANPTADPPTNPARPPANAPATPDSRSAAWAQPGADADSTAWPDDGLAAGPDGGPTPRVDSNPMPGPFPIGFRRRRKRS